MAVPTKEVAAAYAEDERQIAISRIRIGCYLIMALLPLGSIVDYFVYKNQLTDFVLNRIGFAALVVPMLALVGTDWGMRWHRTLGVLIALIPAACIALIMFHTKEQAASPYYAGLNLVVLAIGLVLQWNFAQSIVAVCSVLVMYFAVFIGARSAPEFGIFFNNLWFLLLTGIIVVTGNYIQSQLRFREFALRYELNLSRKDLERSNRRLMELDELKGRFFANISHELRTPLTLLLAPLESLRRELPGPDDRFSESLDTMQANGMRLLKLINDLLELVRLDSGKLKLRPVSVNIGGFFRGLLTSIKRVAEDKGLQIACDLSPELDTIRADPDKLEKVFVNLLFNAVKFTPAGGTVSVECRRDDDMAVLEVSDTGVGIAEENLPFIFDRFWQADSASNRRFQGVGIGLALVKELVEAHQGTVEARSRPGSGTSMVIRLPLGGPKVEPEPAGPAIAKPAPPLIAAPVPAPVGAQVANGNGGGGDHQDWLTGLYRRAEMFTGFTPLRETIRPIALVGPSKRPKLLLADDEPDMLRFLRAQLGDDYEVLEAVDGDQATTLALQYLPDVIVCDMMLPEKDGLQVCKELRAGLSTRSIPFLMLTARADDETKLQALAAGASDFLSKPFSTAELRVRLKNLVDSQRLQKALAWQNQKLEATLEQLKETELQLVQSEKMASLGRMSAGIIHEINNPINFAKTGLYTLTRTARHIPEPERAIYEDTLKDIEEGLTRVAEIVGDLRGFTHGHGGTVEDVDVGHCVSMAMRFLAAEWKDRVEIHNQVAPGFKIRANRNKFIQVIVNLLQNSLDAVRVRIGTASAPTVRISAAGREGIQSISIWDNGVGISPDDLGKVFDPFFTTKEIGQGTGLGLSICYRIVTEIGGRIQVRTELGQFCEITLEFPTKA